MAVDVQAGSYVGCECSECREARLNDDEHLVYTALDVARAYAEGWRDGAMSNGPKDQLATWLHHAYLEGTWLPEHPFAGVTGDRKYRFDFAWPEKMLAIEYQGIGRGHQWANEQAKDWCKLTEAQLCGWLVIVCSAATINDGRFGALLDRAVELER